ncbi:MAG: hypothetical protein ACI90V_009537, partial [Bacillariaceae sp.]
IVMKMTPLSHNFSFKQFQVVIITKKLYCNQI